jgi:hypothetical protein
MEQPPADIPRLAADTSPVRSSEGSSITILLA